MDGAFIMNKMNWILGRNCCCTNRWNNCFEYPYTLHGNSMLPFILVKSPCPPDNIQLWKFTVRHPLLFKHSMFLLYLLTFYFLFFYEANLFLQPLSEMTSHPSRSQSSKCFDFNTNTLKLLL